VTTTCEAIVIGTGAAGLMAACILAEHVRPTLLTDRGLGTSNSAVAQGGLQFPPPGEQAARRLIDDIVTSGGSTVDRSRARAFVADIPATIAQLERWGLEFDREPDGSLVRTQAGGMTQASIVTAGDQIGPALLRVLRGRLIDAADIVTQATVTNLAPVTDGLSVEVADGREFTSRCVIVATGGRSHARAGETGPSTNPPNANESMQSILSGLGLPTVDADRFQLQPYGLVDTFDRRVARCVPESVVALGARVVDAYGDPVAPPTANRLELTAAMHACEGTSRLVPSRDGRPALRLTLSDVDPATILDRYPSLFRLLEKADQIGSDVLVWPVLHYQLGGFVTELDGSTAVPGLYLAGEIVGGLHGRNRLMGNGITDSLVHGRRAALAVLDRLGGSASE
jgi:succinate dehydrogenase / fumarate reductase flavoprotein subunit